VLTDSPRNHYCTVLPHRHVDFCVNRTRVHCCVSLLEERAVLAVRSNSVRRGTNKHSREAWTGTKSYNLHFTHLPRPSYTICADFLLRIFLLQRQTETTASITLQLDTDASITVLPAASLTLIAGEICPIFLQQWHSSSLVQQTISSC